MLHGGDSLESGKREMEWVGREGGKGIKEGNLR